MPHGRDGDQGPTTNAAIPEPGDQADGADEEPCLGSADGDRCQLQQAAAAQGGLLRRAHDDALYGASVYLKRAAPKDRRAIILVSDNLAPKGAHHSEHEVEDTALEFETDIQSIQVH